MTVSERERARETANALAALLKRGLMIARSNPYYGGMGLAYIEGTFIYAPVNDGYVFSPSEAKICGEVDYRIEFAGEQAFVDWLEEFLVSPTARGPMNDLDANRIEEAVRIYKKSDGQDLTGFRH